MKSFIILIISVFIFPKISSGQFKSGEYKKHELTFSSSVLANSMAGDEKSVVKVGFGVEYAFFLDQVSLRTNPTYYIFEQSFFSIPLHIGYRLFNDEQIYDNGIDIEINAGPNIAFFSTNNDLEYDKVIVTKKNGLFGDLKARISTDINGGFVSLVLGYSHLFSNNFQINDSRDEIIEGKINKNFFNISFNVGYRF